MLRDYNAGIDEHKWIRCSRDILVSVGRLDLFHKSVIDNPRSVKMSISRVKNAHKTQASTGPAPGETKLNFDTRLQWRKKA